MILPKLTEISLLITVLVVQSFRFTAHSKTLNVSSTKTGYSDKIYAYTLRTNGEGGVVLIEIHKYLNVYLSR